MKKILIPSCIILFIAACSSPKIYIPNYYESRYLFAGESEADATEFSVKNAGKLAEDYPKENLIYDEIKMTLNFEQNDKYDSAAYYKINDTLANKDNGDNTDTEDLIKNLEKLLNESKKKGKKNITFTLNYDLNKAKSERPIPDGEVFANTDFEYNMLTIKDFVQIQAKEKNIEAEVIGLKKYYGYELINNVEAHPSNQ